MAEALFRVAAQAAGGENFEVASAGISAIEGSAASIRSVEALKDLGINLSGFHSQPVTEKLVDECAAIFVMTADHRHLLEIFFPKTAGKTFLMREFTSAPGDISDPIGAGIETYRRCRDSIKDCIPSILDFLQK